MPIRITSSPAAAKASAISTRRGAASIFRLSPGRATDVNAVTAGTNGSNSPTAYRASSRPHHRPVRSPLPAHQRKPSAVSLSPVPHPAESPRAEPAFLPHAHNFTNQINNLQTHPPFHPLTPCYNAIRRVELPPAVRPFLHKYLFRRPAVLASKPIAARSPLFFDILNIHTLSTSVSTHRGFHRGTHRAGAKNANLMGRTQEMMKPKDLYAGFFPGETHRNQPETHRNPPKSHANPTHRPSTARLR